MSDNNTQRYDVNCRELTVAILKLKGIHDGYWRLNIGFHFSGLDLNLNQQGVYPTAICQIRSAGIIRVGRPEAPDPMIVDAMTENPERIIVPFSKN